LDASQNTVIIANNLLKEYGICHFAGVCVNKPVNLTCLSKHGRCMTI
jgi:hypothetical protein